MWERNTRRKDFLTITYAKDYSVQKYQKQDSYTILQQNVCKYIQDNLWTIAACNGSGYEMYQVSYNWMKHFGQMGFISLRKKKTIWTPPPAPSFTVSFFAVSYRWLNSSTTLFRGEVGGNVFTFPFEGMAFYLFLLSIVFFSTACLNVCVGKSSPFPR